MNMPSGTTRPRMSEILKRLALMLLRAPEATPSAEAAHVALLLAHVGWNRALGHHGMGYEPVLRSIEGEHPNLWSELRSRDCEAMIELIREAKLRSYADDRRVVLVCGIPDDRVHVEWCEEKDFPQAAREVEKSLRRRARATGGVMRRVTRRTGGA
jgi:hypothetical protein